MRPCQRSVRRPAFAGAAQDGGIVLQPTQEALHGALNHYFPQHPRRHAARHGWSGHPRRFEADQGRAAEVAAVEHGIGLMLRQVEDKSNEIPVVLALSDTPEQYHSSI
ncbi:MAG: hypothetical protein OXE84_06895 [Rhodobacteraceae bacterium]|nr:hypothetical protein [Paracoccaceae bacterium]MCY4195583.1 hypothetical protein [Paracoccaceae bacterium]